MNEQVQQQNNKPVTIEQKLQSTVNGIHNTINSYVSDGKLELPSDYSLGNALKQAQLIIQDDSKLMSCSQNSIGKMLLDMAILGLNPSKKQCYFIPYGNTAKLNVSYFGNVSIAKRIDPAIKDITAKALKEGQPFEYDLLDDGFYSITKHETPFNTLDNEFIGGYATIHYNDGRSPKSLIRTRKQIIQAWKQSKMNVVNNDGSIKVGSTHEKFSDDMVQRTCINAITKNIINTSNDGDLFGSTIQSQSLEETKVLSANEVEEKANTGDVIDIDFSDIENFDIDVNTGEVVE